MGEIKAKFTFVSEAADARTTVVVVKLIQIVGQEESFQFPPDMQARNLHEKLFEKSIVKGVVNSLKTRNKFRNIVITLDPELQRLYLDEEGNVVFKGYYLEVSQQSVPPLFPQLLVPANVEKDKSMSSIAKDIVIEKFNGSNFNADTWINMFVKECIRLKISENNYAEILRLFLEGPALDWFSVFLKTHSLSIEWEMWNNSFVDTFGQKSWSEIAYAYNFKYLNGPLLEFALKKRNLILDADPDIPISSQINLIVITLPPFIRNKLDRKINKIDELMSALRQLEMIGNKNKEIKNNNQITRPNKACGFCEKEGFPNRYHTEEICRLKLRTQKQIKNDKIRVANNTEIQEAIACATAAKNE